MTWDIYAIRAPGGVRQLTELPDHYTPAEIGDPREIAEVVRQVAPHADTSDPTWLTLSAPDHHVEVALGKGLKARDVVFYVSSGDGAVPLILDVCRRLDITAYDTETGDILTTGSRPPVPPPLGEDEVQGGGKRRWWQRHRG